MPSQPIKVAFLGPGGLGGLLSAPLARLGYEVGCFAREPTCNLIIENGISVHCKRLGNSIVKVQPALALVLRVNACLVVVKAPQLDSELGCVSCDALGCGVILNSFELIAALRNRCGNAVILATRRVEAACALLRVMEVTSPFATVELALAEGSRSASSTDGHSLKNHLIDTGPNVAIRQDETSMLWGKLCFLAPLALLTTHNHKPARFVRLAHRSDLLLLIQEGSETANRVGPMVDEKAVAKLFGSILETVRRSAVAGWSIQIEVVGGAILRAPSARRCRSLRPQGWLLIYVPAKS